MTLLDELDQLEKEATGGPWSDHVSDSYGTCWHIEAPPCEDLKSVDGDYLPVASNMRSGDAEFAAKLRNSWPKVSKALRAADKLADECEIVDGSPCHMLTNAQRQALVAFRQALAELETK